MSDDKNSPLEFSAFDLMPDWAQESSDTKTSAPKPQSRSGDDDRGKKGRRGGGGGNFERRGGPREGRGQGGGGFRGGDRDRRGGGGDRRGGGGRDRRGGNRRGDNDRRGGGRPFNEEDENFEIKGLKLSFEPTPEAAKSLSKHIQESAKAYPVADLAKMVANSRERYQIRIFSDKNGPKLYRGKEDGSAWLSRDEAINNFLNSRKLLEKYYVVEEVALDAPKGNFSTIAVCGFSGEVLGPPNHHEYQGNIARLHRERFSNMPLERYKQRIEMEAGEEILEKWKEKVSKTFQYRLKSDEVVAEEPVVEDEVAPTAETPETGGDAPAESTGEPTAEATEEAPEATGEAPEAVAEPAPEEPADESVEPEASAEEEEASPDEPAAEETPAPEEKKEDALILKNRSELEMHFRQNFADQEIVETKSLVLRGNIPGNKLSRDLLTLLKVQSKKLRRGFPFEMFQAVCSCLEKEGLKFFKRGKKALHVSMVRPQAINENVQMTERIAKIVALIKEKPRIQTMALLENLCENFKRPDKNDKEAKPELDDEAKGILADIRWLAMEGLIVEFPDTRLEIGKNPPQANEGQKKQPGKNQKSAKKKSGNQKNAGLPGGICTFTVVDSAS